MVWYVVKLLVLLPLIGLMIWGSLKLAQRMQNGMGNPQRQTRAVRVVETVMLSPTLKLAVLEFHGREILVSTSRGGLVRLAEAPARPALPTAEPENTAPLADPQADRPSFAQSLRSSPLNPFGRPSGDETL